MIELRRIEKNYRRGAEDVRALRGVDLSVEKEELLAITGPSGAGKTTLLHILGCLESILLVRIHSVALLLPFSFGVPLYLDDLFSFLPGHYTPLFYSFEPIDTIVYLEYRPRLPLTHRIFRTLLGLLVPAVLLVSSSC